MVLQGSTLQHGIQIRLIAIGSPMLKPVCHCACIRYIKTWLSMCVRACAYVCVFLCVCQYICITAYAYQCSRKESAITHAPHAHTHNTLYALLTKQVGSDNKTYTNVEFISLFRHAMLTNAFYIDIQQYKIQSNRSSLI